MNKTNDDHCVRGNSAALLYNVDKIKSEQLNDWGEQPDCLEGISHSQGILLWKGSKESPEAGLWECTPGRWHLSIPEDEFCHFISGNALYESETGEKIPVNKGTCVLFPAGWKGTCTVNETIRNVYMLTIYGSEDMTVSAKIINNPELISDTTDWGIIPTMIKGESHTSGLLLHKGKKGESETGIWICTEGHWACNVTSDEFCHFLSGRATYTHESGEVIEIFPNTIAFFPTGWNGACVVHETVRKTYMIR